MTEYHRLRVVKDETVHTKIETFSNPRWIKETY